MALEKNQNMWMLVSFSILLVAARLIPHPENWTPVLAATLFFAAQFGRKEAFGATLAAMLVSDAVIGFYPGMWFVYGSLVAVGIFAFVALKNRNVVAQVGLGSMGAAIIFFLLSNLGVFATSGMYVHSFEGLVSCYVAAIPFFKNTLLSTIIYSSAFFGLHQMVKQVIARPQANAA